MTTYEKLWAVSRALINKYPNGNEPFQMVSALCEETGELAKEVNHFEGTGIKREKYGEPNRDNFAGEVIDVLTVVLRIVEYYELESDMEARLDRKYEKLKKYL